MTALFKTLREDKGSLRKRHVNFTVIIPVYNGAQKIGRTIDSVLSQTALEERRAQVRLIVVDGGSPDGTADVAAGYADSRIEIVSEPDTGMYDALAKGLSRAGGDVTCYMSAGDIFDPHAFGVVAEVFARYSEVSWLTGLRTERNGLGQVIGSLLPHTYHRAFFRNALMAATSIP